MSLYKTSSGEVRVSVPLIGGDEQQQTYRRKLFPYGIGDVMLLSAYGEFVGTGLGAINDTTYARAFEEVRYEEELKKLPGGATEHVLNLILSGTFDISDWALWYGLPAIDQNANSQTT